MIRLLPPSPVSKLVQKDKQRLRKRDNLLTGEGGGGGGGAKSYDVEKVWPIKIIKYSLTICKKVLIVL